MCARVCGSRPTVGSSRNSTRGECRSPRAISRRRRIPPENVDDDALAPLPELDHLEDVAEPVLGGLAGDSVQLRVEPEVLLGGEVLVERRVLEDEADVPADVGRTGRDVEPGHRGAPAGRAKQRAQDVDRRGLAGAVRPEEPERLPRRHVEGHAVDRDDVVEGLPEAVDDHRRGVAHRDPSSSVRAPCKARRPESRSRASLCDNEPTAPAAIDRYVARQRSSSRVPAAVRRSRTRR